MKLIIGLVGEKGSGKDTFATELQKYLSESFDTVSIGRCRSSEILATTLHLWQIPTTRKNLQDMAIVMDQHFGKGTQTKVLLEHIKALPHDIIIFDAVRWQSDADMIRSFPKNLLVYVTAPLETRYTRTKSRKEKVGEAFATLEQFKKEEQAATEVDIPGIGAKADTVIDNSTSPEHFSNSIREFCHSNIELLLQSN